MSCRSSYVEIVVCIKFDTAHSSASSNEASTVFRDPPPAQRTWSIQAHKISRYSEHLRAACEHNSTTSLELDGTTFSLTTFQNFIDFSHSSIYSVNRSGPDHDPIRTHIQAWLLGALLKAPTYQTAALRQLHTCIEPPSQDLPSSAAYDLLSPGDIDLVCAATEEDCVLRALVFDAVAAHWTLRDAIAISTITVSSTLHGNTPELGARAVSLPELWTAVFNAHADFRARILNSLSVRDERRGRILRPVEDYIAGRTGLWEDDGVEVSVSPALGVRAPRAGYAHGSRGRSWAGEGQQRRVELMEVGEEEYMFVEDA